LALARDSYGNRLGLVDAALEVELAGADGQLAQFLGRQEVDEAYGLLLRHPAVDELDAGRLGRRRAELVEVVQRRQLRPGHAADVAALDRDRQG
jgi:hypothetical protein